MSLTSQVHAATAAEVDDVSVTFRAPSADGVVHALQGVSLTLQVGTFTAVIGPSGSGKSTLLMAMCGLQTVDSGSVRVGATEIGALDRASSLEILAILHDLVAVERRTILMVTHDPAAAAAADRLLVLVDGRLVEDVAPRSTDHAAAILAAHTRGAQ